MNFSIAREQEHQSVDNNRPKLERFNWPDTPVDPHSFRAFVSEGFPTFITVQAWELKPFNLA